MADTDERREYLLASLRVASLRARLYETEINSIGTALKAGIVDCYGAVEWMKEIGALGLMKYIPEDESSTAGGGPA